MRIDEAKSRQTNPRRPSMLETKGAIVLQRGRETLRVEPWGRNSVRVRVSLGPREDDGLGALLASLPTAGGAASFEGGRARLVVDDLAVDVDEDGRLRFTRVSDGDEVLAEEPI